MSLNNKIFASYVMIFVTILFMSFYPHINWDSIQKKENKAYCGVKDATTGDLREGKKLFRILCASCHKINKRLIGPALGNIKIDSIQLYNYITKDTTHNPVFHQLTFTNTSQVLKYLKQE